MCVFDILYNVFKIWEEEKVSVKKYRENMAIGNDEHVGDGLAVQW